MNPQEPMIPDPDAPAQDPIDDVDDPHDPDDSMQLEGYDKTGADSFPASDPPSMP